MTAGMQDSSTTGQQDYMTVGFKGWITQGPEDDRKDVLHCCKSWRNISFPSDISELFHEDITTNISEKCSP
jgi:hypothetical protein